LINNTEYEFAVAGVYDALDGKGNDIYILSRESIQTNPFIFIDSVIETQSSVTFDLNVNDPDLLGEITSIELFQNETLITTLNDGSVRTFNALLSNTLYTVKVTYTFDLLNGAGIQNEITTYEIRTLSKETPTVNISNIISSKNDIIFEVEIVDIDSVGEISSISLYREGTLFEALSNLDERAFNGLFNNSQYNLEVVYSYDLNDGLGIQFLEINTDVSTTILNGLGTIEEPYQIESVEDLKSTYLLLDHYFVLLNDIVINEIDWQPIDSFSGELDGQNYSISGLSMNGNYNNVGLNIGLFKTFNGVLKNIEFSNVNIDIFSLSSINFGVVSGTFNGTVQNLNIDANVNITSISEMRVGGVAGIGDITNSENISLNLTIDLSNDSYTYFGGILADGTFDGSRISMTGNVDIGTTTGHILAGGLLGITTQATITDAFTNMYLEANNFEEKRLGGLIGHTNGSFSLDKIYTKGFIGNYNSPDYTYSGGIVGYIENPMDSVKVIMNSISSINIIHTGYDDVGNIFGNSRGGLLLVNVYRTSNQTIFNANEEEILSSDANNLNISTMQYTDLSDLNTYLDLLKWNETDVVYTQRNQELQP
jgi:hypothetical protein